MTIDDYVLRAIVIGATTMHGIGAELNLTGDSRACFGDAKRLQSPDQSSDRIIGRSLQRLRKRGLIRYAGGKWSVCE